jgi:hypothetical protein
MEMIGDAAHWIRLKSTKASWTDSIIGLVSRRVARSREPATLLLSQDEHCPSQRNSDSDPAV